VKLHFARIKNTFEMGRDSSSPDINMDDENMCRCSRIMGHLKSEIFLPHIFSF
jgi:hypothetical protein